MYPISIQQVPCKVAKNVVLQKNDSKMLDPIALFSLELK